MIMESILIHKKEIYQRFESRCQNIACAYLYSEFIFLELNIRKKLKMWAGGEDRSGSGGGPNSE